MILLIFSQQWAKAKLNYFKVLLGRCLHKANTTVECAETIRRTAEIRDERVDAISGRPTLVMNDERLMMDDRNSSLVGRGYPVVSLSLRREAGENGREVQIRWRGVSFFRRGAKKLGRNAIGLKLPALSFSLATILFCVCLAHAGQRGVGNPAVAGVALKIVPLLQIKWRNAGKNGREVQKRWRDVSFFRRGAKKLGRNAITSKRSALSFSLATILFCVCLAHARQRGLGTLAATGVALKIVPLLQIKWRNAGKKRREVQKRRRGVSFFRRGVKKLGRNAITSKRSALSFSLATILFCVCLAHAGQRGVGNPAAAGVAFATDSIKPLHIGDTIPEGLWNLPLQMVKAGQEGSTTVTLNDYKGKLIILDFWATYCSPCVAAFPKMDSLRNLFPNDLAILPISLQDKPTVAAFLDNMQKRVPIKGFSLVNEKPLLKFFPHKEIPHYVWVDPKGFVKAITGGEDVNSVNIKALLAGEIGSLRLKKDVYRKFDFDNFLLSGKNDVDKGSVLVHNTLTSYVEGFPARFGLRDFDNIGTKRLYALNISIAKLFRIAFSELDVTLMHDSRFRLAVQDTNEVITGLRGEPFKQWARKHTYCYELVGTLNRETLFERMRNDLQLYLPYTASIEQEEMECLVLKRTEQKSLHATAGKPTISHNAFHFKLQNASWRYLPQYLSVYYLQNQPPILDETGLDGPIDLELECRMSSIVDLNNALDRYGLCISREKRKLEVIVLRDK
ncbi:TlpA family protein disulfide reductase [Olivibacter domesticus]|nr:TlpA disulfide reductase family protein [Olivibacter domesticus]